MASDTYSGPSIDILKSLPPEAFKVIPFAAPPAGVEPNFENPVTRVPVILGLSITFLIIATLCLGVRIHTKLAIVKKWKWDDTLGVSGFIFSIVYFSSVVIGCRGGAVGRHGWDIHLDKALSHESLIQSFVCTIMASPALGLIKMSILIQYYYLFGVMSYVRYSVYIVGTLTAMFYIPVSITSFVMCSPWPRESLLDLILSWHYLKFAKVSIPGGVIGMLVDWILFILPMPAVWSLHVDRRKKLGIMLIFATGALGVASSMMSLYYRVLLQNDPTDTTWKVGYTLLWTQVEMWAGVTASCMPSVKQFFSRYGPSVSHGTTLKPSLPSFRRSTREKIPESEGGFRMWGYKSNAETETENTTRITHGSADVEMENLKTTNSVSRT